MNYNFSTGWSNLNDVWTALYGIVEEANQNIEGIRNSSLLANGTNNEIKTMQRYLGESLTIRALIYLDLVRFWGDVPLSLEATKSDLSNAYLGKTDRDALYQLTDLFSLFFIKFVDGNNGQDEQLWSKLSGKGLQNAWSGYAFEQVCLHHIPQIKKALGINGIISNVHSWMCKPFTDKDGTKWSGGQIDLLIDRADDVINICEIKYASDRYCITAEYEEKLRNRASLLRRVIKTNKALSHTFITTYGVVPNSHSGIVQSEVTMDDLFK
jgi:hypothetical protein